jgi:hypothetical protein
MSFSNRFPIHAHGLIPVGETYVARMESRPLPMCHLGKDLLVLLSLDAKEGSRLKHNVMTRFHENLSDNWHETRFLARLTREHPNTSTRCLRCVLDYSYHSFARGARGKV